MTGNTIKTIILHILFITGIVFLFVGGPGHNASRSMGNLWNMGHIALFVLFVFILYADWRDFGERPIGLQWVLVVSLGGVLALSTELIQSLAGRHFDYMDIYRDLSGCIIGMILLSRTGVYHRGRENFLRAAVIVFLLLIASVPLFISLADEYIASRQFPLLSGFETPLEIKRWRADGEISISEQFHHSGDFSLRARFTTRKYSRVTMKYSLGKWEGYQQFEFSIFNPDTTVLKAYCRIHDEEHRKHDNAYTDRFHRSFILENGWNTISIPIDDIRNAPSSREMDLTRIEGITFFTVSLPSPRTVYLDDILLTRSN